ncbi:MAG: N-6 DNA methylase [Methylococcaceae bacterium]
MTDKHTLQTLINQFSGGDLKANALALFKELGYQSPRTFNKPVAEILRGFDHEKALCSEWINAPFLFQLAQDNLSNIQSLLTEVDGTIIESYMFVAIELEKSEYSRTQLVTITRELNKSPQPVLILFKHGDTLTLSVIHRRLHKRDESKDVLEKVTLLKDIRISDPHRAHVDILADLAFDNLNLKAGASFVDLHNAWQSVLDTKTLNKQFYKELSQWYFWAMKEVYFPDAENIEAIKGGVFEDENKVREHNAKNLIRLLTRLLFVWFIKEKNLIPEQLFNEDWINAQLDGFKPQISDKSNATFQANDSHYYRAILQNLFFATLNQTCEKRGFRNDGQHRNVTNLMRYKSYFNEPESFLNLMTDVVPFMNGGLFDCLDKVVPDLKGKQGGDVIAYEDGFSDRVDNKLRVPDYIFFGAHKNVDLSEELGNKQKSVEIKGLIDILKSYKFTITENTPIEEDIALDPELLGQVFENLLASYNPETKTTARKQTGSFYTPREIVDYMVDESLKAYFKSKLDYLTAEQLDDLLSYTKATPEFSESEKTALIEAIDTCKILDPACGSGAFPMGVLHKLVFILGKIDPDNELWKQRQIKEKDSALQKRIIEAFTDNEVDYARKLYLIENCIYGVDIQAIAIQISKLRFFISLIVDQKVDRNKTNFGVLPLPNLETKFVAANTLIGIEKPKAQISLFDNKEIEALEEQLKKVRHSLFSVRSPSRKRELREEDKQLREQIGALLEQHGWGNETAQQLAHWNPYDQNANADFFDVEWMFGENGFDIVIGNPPYVQVKKGLFSESQFPYSEGKDKGKQNLYKVFTEQSFNLIKEGGVASLIVQSSLMADVSAQYTRELLLTQTKISFFIEFPKKSSNADGQVFENVLQGTCAYLFKKDKPDKQTSFKVSINNDVTTVKNLVFDNLNQSELIKIYPNGFFIPLVKPKEFELLRKIFRESEPLKERVESIRQGDLNLTSAKDFFSNAKTNIKLFRGKHISRYMLNSNSDEFVATDYLTDKVKLNKENTFIVGQEVTGTVDLHRLHFCQTPVGEEFLFGHTANKILLRNQNESGYIVAILNCSLLDWFFRKTSTNNHVMGYEIEALPIPKIPETEQQPFIELVDKILADKKAGNDTSALEREIDRLVYGLYGLSDEEILIVEGGK